MYQTILTLTGFCPHTSMVELTGAYVNPSFCTFVNTCKNGNISKIDNWLTLSDYHSDRVDAEILNSISYSAR